LLDICCFLKSIRPIIEKSKNKILEVKKKSDVAFLSPQRFIACKKLRRAVEKYSVNWGFETFLNNRIPPLCTPYFTKIMSNNTFNT